MTYKNTKVLQNTWSHLIVLTFLCETTIIPFCRSWNITVHIRYLNQTGLLRCLIHPQTHGFANAFPFNKISIWLNPIVLQGSIKVATALLSLAWSTTQNWFSFSWGTKSEFLPPLENTSYSTSFYISVLFILIHYKFLYGRSYFFLYPYRT